MEATIKEIAALLRSTEPMATQFVQRVQTRVGRPVSETEVLAAMKKMSAKSLSMEKVVAKLQQQRKSADRRTTGRNTNHPGVRSKGVIGAARAKRSTIAAPQGAPRTILEKLESVLKENWERAETEGLQPQRMSAEAFVTAIYQYTDRREGTRQRILQAAKQLDHSDVMLTPALVADIVHELFEG